MFRITCSKCGESADIGVGMPAQITGTATPSVDGTFKAGDPVPKAYWDVPKPERWGKYKLWTEKGADGKTWYFKAPDPM